MSANYFFIDGSALSAQIRQLRRGEPGYRNRKLCPSKFIYYFMASLKHLHRSEYKRATFYFPQGDEAELERYIKTPDFRVPGEIEDLHFKFCGQKLKRSAEFNEFVENHVPGKFRDRFQKSEKGIDIEMCCDALRLAVNSSVDRLFILTNDGDFVPFCRTIKEFGANISLIHLFSRINANIELVKECDSYSVVESGKLEEVFLPPDIEEEDLDSSSPERSPLGDKPAADFLPQSEKPEAEPSDLSKIEE